MAKALTCGCGAALVRTGSRGPLPSVCANCKRTNADHSNRRWRAANVERVRDRQRLRIQEWKDRNRDRVRAEGREYMRQRLQDPAFREQQRQASNARRLADPEKAHEIRKRSYVKHAEQRRAQRRERAQAKRMEIYERDGGRCHICGKTASRTDFHIDHLIPVSKGGVTIPENLAVAHARCNQERGAGRLPAQLRLVG